MTVTSAVETIRDEKPTGQVKVATRDLTVPATDSQGREMQDGHTLVARQGRRIPTPFLEHPLVEPHAVTMPEFEKGIADGSIVATARTKTDLAAQELAKPKTATADTDAADLPISKWPKPRVLKELAEREIEHDPKAGVADLRKALEDAIAAGDDENEDEELPDLPDLAEMDRDALIAELEQRDVEFDADADDAVLRDELGTARVEDEAA